MKITPTSSTQYKYNEYNQHKRSYNSLPKDFYHSSPSFKGDAVTTLFQTAQDKKVYSVLTKFFGEIPERVDKKLVKLASEGGLLGHKARFDLNKGVTSIQDKTIPTSIKENVIFPFITLPSYFGSWLLKKAEKIPSEPIKKQVEKVRSMPIFRVPRKINEMDSLTNSIKGMYQKTTQLVNDFAKKKGGDITADTVYSVLSKSENQLTEKEIPLFKEASEFIQENLYKTSNKYFDKHTGNFNTAYERPLNRIVTGMIPVVFLANDAYNLSVLCGDKKEDSIKEAKSRTKQEITRVITTAYIQLLTFGAFTKYVNTKAWFTPLTSALTVLGSEIFARRRMGKPIMFLTKEGAKEYNRIHKDDDKKAKSTGFKSRQASKNTAAEQVNVPDNTKFKTLNMSVENDKSGIFTSFKGTENKEKTEEKKPQQKALINFKTFKKGVGILLAGGFLLSFIKNSSYTKDTKLISGLRDLGEKIKEKVYNPLAFKDFEISEKSFQELTKSLEESGHKSLADGHRLIREKYGQEVGGGIIKLYKATLSKKDVPNVINSVMTEFEKMAYANLTEAQQKTIEALPLEKQQEEIANMLSSQKELIRSALTTALKLNPDNIAEKKFDKISRQTLEILKNKKAGLNDNQVQFLNKEIIKAIAANTEEEAVQIDRATKPFVDMVTQPFKFIGSVLAFPFKKIATPLIGLATSGVEKRIKNATLGTGELKKYDKAIHKIVTEIYGEKSPKAGKISQTVFANAVEQLDKVTAKYREAQSSLSNLINETSIEFSTKKPTDTRTFDEIFNAKGGNVLGDKVEQEKIKLSKYVTAAVEKSFDGITQSSKKNTDLAMMSKLASSTVTSAFLVADNYNMVMLKSDGEDKEGAKEKANERIIQRLSALFYQTMLINWFNATFTSTYNSSLKGMAMVSGPNTIATEVLTRKSIGMPLGRKTLDELNAIDEKNENRKGFLGHYFKFMRLLTGKKPLKDRLPKNKQTDNNVTTKQTSNSNLLGITSSAITTNVLEMLANK